MNRRQLLASAVALPVVLYGGTAFAVARWQYFEADPAYSTRGAALRDAENVFVRAGWPRSVAKAMASKMRAGEGERHVITTGDRFDFMRSGPKGLWRNVVADFKEKPKERGTEFAVTSERWVHTEGGITYEAFLPHTCFNIAGRSTTRVQAVKRCAYVLFEARADDDYAVVHILGRHEPDGCEISVNGPAPGGTKTFDEGAYRPLVDSLPNRCPTDFIPSFYGLSNFKVGSFKVRPGWYAVKVPLVFADNLGTRVVVCLVKKDGQSTHAMGVQYFEYHVQETSGRKIAVIWYSEEDVPVAYRGSTGLWWRWSMQQTWCRSA